MWFGIITLFPEMLDALNYGIVGRALQNEIIKLKCWNPRDFSLDKNQRIDDRPYGGGPGMLMQVQPLRDAIIAAKAAASEKCKVIYLSPQGQLIEQTAIKKFAQEQQLILVAGRYEGIDERLISTVIDEEWSIGDYVLSGGELAAMVMIDAITRLLPEALGDADSIKDESFNAGLLDYPHYTRPAVVEGQAVPEILLSGNHEIIKRWRLQQALGRTWLKRPDLLKKRGLSTEEKALLDEFIIQLRSRT